MFLADTAEDVIAEREFYIICSKEIVGAHLRVRPPDSRDQSILNGTAGALALCAQAHNSAG